MQNILTLTGLETASLSASDEARKKRDALLADALCVKAVVTAAQAEAAGDALRSLKTFTRMIEDARVSAGAPVLALTRKINDLAKELTMAAESEATRISQLVGSYNQEQARQAEKRRQDALAEEERIRAETRAKLDAAEEAGASEKKLDKIEDKAFEKLAVANAETAAAVAPKLRGIATRPETCFEVFDVAALYKSFPQLVSLTPNNQAIKAILKSCPGGLPGVKHWVENRAIVR